MSHQYRVPGEVAEDVVDGLETVDIEECDCQGLAGMLGRCDHRLEAFDQVAPVVQPGQVVPACLFDQGRPEQVHGLDLDDQVGVRRGQAPVEGVGLTDVACDI